MSKELTAKLMRTGSYNVDIAIALGIPAAILLEGILFWVDDNRVKNRTETHYFDGRWWMYSTIKEWAAFYPEIKERTIERHLATLSDLGLILKGDYSTDRYVRPVYYTADLQTITDFMLMWNDYGCPSRNDKEIKQFFEDWKIAKLQKNVGHQRMEGTMQ